MSRIGFPALAACAAALMPVTASAQDGVFDMGQLTGTLSQDHVTQSERARAGKSQPRDPKTVEKICVQYLPVYRKQYSSRHPKVAQLGRLCRQAGY